MLISKALRSFKRSAQPKLFTPGPLSTTQSVKDVANFDYATREAMFNAVSADVKQRILRLAEVSPSEYGVVLLSGSGTFGVEAALGTSFPRRAGQEFLILSNGAYGERQARICQYLKIPHRVLRYPENEHPDLKQVLDMLDSRPAISHVSIIHSETTSGILNPVEEIGAAIADRKLTYLIDGMSSFGCNHVDFKRANVAYLVSSANKMLQGLPGVTFVICRLSDLLSSKGNSRSLTLDLYEEYKYAESNNHQFRFTSPAGIVFSLHQALVELEAEGGRTARSRRYQENQDVLVEDMQKLGFRVYVPREKQGSVLTTFHELEHPRFDMKRLNDYLEKHNFLLYPGKLLDIPTFRIGNIGDLHAADMRRCAQLIKEALAEMGVIN